MATPRLKELYKSEIVSKLESELAIDNINKVPRLEKIVVNMGVGEAASDSKQLDAAMNDMRIITGQQPCVTRAKKSIAGFHIREGQAIGCKVTLRGDRMWEFLDRLLSMALPRVRDFRGISRRASTAVATTPSASPSSSSSPRLNTTRSIVPAAWTSPLSPLPKTTNRPRLFSTLWASRSRNSNSFGKIRVEIEERRKAWQKNR